MVLAIAVTQCDISCLAGLNIGERLPKGGHVGRIDHRHVVGGKCLVNFSSETGQFCCGVRVVFKTRSFEMCIERRKIECVAS